MKFFKKTGVAVILTILIVALCCVWGYSRNLPDPQPQGGTYITEHKVAGENTLNYFLDLVEDNAHLFSLSVKDSLAKMNLSLASTYDSVIAVQTVNYLNGKDIGEYAREEFDLFGGTGLSDMDMLLVLSPTDEDWYLVYGSGIRQAVESDDTLANLFSSTMQEDFFTEGVDVRILSLFAQMEDWYADHVTPIPQTEGNTLLQGGDKVQDITLSGIVKGIILTLLANVWWIIILLLILSAVDRARYARFRNQPPPVGAGMPVGFRPLLFWHHSGSRWFRRMEERLSQSEMGGSPFGGFGGTSTSQRRDSGSDGFGGFGQ